MMNRKSPVRLLAWALVLALWAGMLPACAAEEAGIEAPVAELGAFLLGDGDEVSEASGTATVLAAAMEADAALVEDIGDGDAEAVDALMAAASGFVLNAEALRLGVKETFTLMAALDGAAVTGARFESDAPKVAAVTSKGKLTAKKAGYAVITVTWGGYAATCAVEVAKAPSKVTLSQTSASLGTGETLRLAAFIPEDSASGMTWKSSRASVASVDATGLVRAVSKGTATITARACNGKKATCKVTVTAMPTDLRFDPPALRLSVGQSCVPVVQMTGGTADYALSVSGDAVAAEGRTLTAVQTGSAVVTASTRNGLAARLEVTVLPAPTSVRFPQDSYALGEKDSLALTPVFDADVPAGLTFRTSDAKVAPVTEGGVVTGKKAGRATITVTTHNGLTAACAVQVHKAPSKVTLNRSSLTLAAGDTFQLEGSFPANSYSTLSWKSNKPAVATVSEDGLVTAVGKGTAKITATTANKKKATCKVKVAAPPTRITLSRESMALNPGRSDTVSWSLDGEGEVDVTIEDTDVAVISGISGSKVTVRGKAAGETVLTAATANGLTATMTIVVEPEATYLRLDETGVTLAIGETYAIIPDTDATALTFTSSKKSVAEVSAEGVVTAAAAGSATITVRTANGKTAKLKVTVTRDTALTVSPASVTLSPYEYCELKVSRTGASFSSSDPSVAYVSVDGVVTGIRSGEAVVTAAVGGQTASCRVTVVGTAGLPAAPASVKLRAVDASTLSVSWAAVDGADGYRVYLGTSSKPAEAALYSGFDAWTNGATLEGVRPDTIYHVFVTAYNAEGETPLADAAHTMARTPGSYDGYNVELNYPDSLMLELGAQKTLFATVSPSGYRGSMTWETSSAAVTLADSGAGSCAIYAAQVGEARVSVRLDSGMTASVDVWVVDTWDLTDANLSTVQKAVARNEELMNADEGGDVLWTLLERRLEASGMSTESANAIVGKVRTSEALYRDIYVYSMGTYNIVANAERDKSGNLIGVTQFRIDDNTLYLVRSNSGMETYTCDVFHETGHAVDFNGAGGMGLYSENDEATAAIWEDVGQLLEDRVDEAIAMAGVSASRVDAEKVVDAVLDYRTLLNESAVLSRLNADEKKVYHQLIELMESEMNATLSINSATMVWDAIEGATNFAVTGKFGHAYLLNIPEYAEIARHYYFDASGSASITTEPWAEYFSCNLMQDTATLAVNLSYLPRTCQYFAETLAPKLLEVFKKMVISG